MHELERYIVIGDATDMKSVDAGSAALTHISPPYLGKHHSGQAKENERILLVRLLTEAARVTDNPYGFVVSYNTDYYDKGGIYARHIAVYQAALESGLELYAQKYILTKAPGKNDTFRMTMHHIQVFIHDGTKDKVRTRNKRLGVYEPDVWGVYPVSQHVGEFRDAIPPESVVIPIANFTETGELVVSQCTGTGTAVIAALIMGRQAVGYEINPDRLKLMKLRQELFEKYFSDPHILKMMQQNSEFNI